MSKYYSQCPTHLVLIVLLVSHTRPPSLQLQLQRMVMDPRCPSMHDKDFIRLRELVLEGAFYTGNEAAVAVEMENL